MGIYSSNNQREARYGYPKYDKFVVFKRFMESVDIGSSIECWNWKGPIRNGTHGVFTWHNKHVYYAHIASYILFVGNIPKRHGKKKLCVCHSCDNGMCVNPAHLWLGTAKQNSEDCVSKGRQSHGEDHYKAVLSKRDVDKIRTKYATGKYSQQRLADKYGVNQTLVSAIVTNKIWKPLTKSIQ